MYYNDYYFSTSLALYFPSYYFPNYNIEKGVGLDSKDALLSQQTKVFRVKMENLIGGLQSVLCGVKDSVFGIWPVYRLLKRYGVS